MWHDDEDEVDNQEGGWGRPKSKFPGLELLLEAPYPRVTLHPRRESGEGEGTLERFSEAE